MGSTREDTSEEGAEVLWLCNAFICRAQGLSPKITLWLYKCVIIPKVAYAAVTWWDIMDMALAWSELERLQRAVCTMFTGEMRTTPAKVLEMLLDLPTLGTAMESATLMAAYRLQSPNPRNLLIGRNWIWTKVDKVDSQFSMIKDHVTLWRTFSKYRIMIPTREEQEENWPNQLKKGHVWFTDGACNL